MLKRKKHLINKKIKGVLTTQNKQGNEKYVYEWWAAPIKSGSPP